MAEVTGARPDEAHDLAVARAGRIGRRMATVIYLIGLAYMVVVGFGTVIRAVYARAPAAAIASVSALDCDRGADVLTTELVEHASLHVRAQGTSALAFLSDWDTRFRALRERCDGDRYATLERLRYHIELTLRRFDREEARWIRHLRPTPAGATRATPE